MRRAKTPWSGVVLVCTKCARRCGRDEFGKQLKKASKLRPRGARLKVIEVKCLKLCPKRHLTVGAAGRAIGGGLFLVDPAASAAETLDGLHQSDAPEIR